MGVVRGPDGRFYEIPDAELERYAVPHDKVKELLRQEGEQPPQAAAPQPGAPPPGPPPAMPGGPGGPVVIQVFTSGPPAPPPGMESETVAQDGWGAWAQQTYQPQQIHQIVLPWPNYYQQPPPQPPRGS